MPQWRAAPKSATQWLAGKTRQDLECLELEGRPLYRDAIRRRNPKTGEVEEVPVRLRTPTPLEQTRARLDASRWVAKLAGKAGTITVAEAAAQVGEQQLDALETICVLALCIREDEPPHGQYATADILASGQFPRAALWDMWDRVAWHLDNEDPRVADITEEQFWVLVEAIDKTRNLSPLVALAGATRDSCVTSMASRLWSYRTGRSCSGSTEGSSPGV